MAQKDYPYNLSISRLLTQQFGVSLSFEPNIEKLPDRVTANSLGTNYYAMDQFGREVFLPIELKYTDNDGNEEAINLYHAVLSVDGANNSINTPLTEREGVFREATYGDNWKFEIDGFLISDSKGNYPEELFRQLVRLKKARVPVQIKNAKTDIVLMEDDDVGNDKIWIDSVRFPSTRGVMDVVPFIISCSSYTEFNLYEIE